MMKQHSRHERIIGLIPLDLLSGDVEELIVLLHPKEERRPDGVVQLPPSDVAIIVLCAVLVRVAVRGKEILLSRCIVDAAEPWRARIDAGFEGAIVSVVLVAEPRNVVRRARHAERARVRAIPLVVFVSVKHVLLKVFDHACQRN